MSHIFISHSTKDNEITQAICKLLNNHGMGYWVDLEKLQDKSLDWRERIITDGIEPAVAVMVLVSPDSSASDWVRGEIAASTYRKKKFVTVLIAGDERNIPLDLTRLGFIDLRKGLTSANEEKLLNAIRLAQALPQPSRPVSRPTGSDANPFPVSQVIKIDTLLKQVIADVSRESKYIWRTSLLWFQESTWYMTAENGRYQDDEKRLWLEKGRGFAGKLWAANDTRKYAPFFPSEYSLHELAEELNLSKEQAEITQRMRAIVCFPIVNPSTGEMVGMLSLDAIKPEKSRAAFKNLSEATLNKVTLLVTNFFVDYVALHYQSFWGLRHLLRVARLLPPLDAPTRAGIYWEHTQKHELYMIVSSEREPSDWSTKVIPLARNSQPKENRLVMVHQAWTQNKNQFVEVQPGRWGTALPIHDGQDRTIGVLTLEWDRPMTDEAITVQEHQLEHLTMLAAKVLDGRTRPWHD